MTLQFAAPPAEHLIEPPAEVFCLGEFLADEMTVRGWTSADVAQRMGTGRDLAIDCFCVELLLAVQDDNLKTDDGTFAGLARAFDVSEQFLRNLEAIWRQWPSRRVAFEAAESLFAGVFT